MKRSRDDFTDEYYEEMYNDRRKSIRMSKEETKNNDDETIDIHVNKKNKEQIYSKNNKIFFVSGVNKTSVDKLIQLIEDKNFQFENLKKNRLVKRVEPNPIYLHITSYGGCLFSGFKAADAISRSKIPIYTIIDGYAASAGTIMSIVGKRRYITPRSYMLIHQLSSTNWGKFAEIEDDYINSKMLMKDIVNIYVKHTKMDRTYIEDQLKHDSWWGSDKCLDKGLVDSIYY
jgi:ATP-dependent Clp protease protease subunit